MQQVILEGNNDKLPVNAIGIQQLDKRDIVATWHDIAEVIGLLVMDPTGKWFVTDLLNGYNHYPNSHRNSIEECLGAFGRHIKIFKFDTELEFAEWLNDHIRNKLAKD